MNINLEKLPEVISPDEFLQLMDQFNLIRVDCSRDVVLDFLEILGEKFEKFYDLGVLTTYQRDIICSELIKMTDFDDLKVIERLIGVMFQFRVDGYVGYLKENLNRINSLDIRKEVNEALEEYLNSGE